MVFDADGGGILLVKTDSVTVVFGGIDISLALGLVTEMNGLIGIDTLDENDLG